MATTAQINKSERNEELITKYREKRAQLKKDGDWAGLQKLPRSSSRTRRNRRCLMTGRPRAVYRKFRISRIALRELALEGKIPGMKKASW